MSKDPEPARETRARCGECGETIYDVIDDIRSCGHLDAPDWCFRHLGEPCACFACRRAAVESGGHP